MNLKIRKAKREDYSFTEELIKEAFAHETYSDHNEHKLVAKLRQSDTFVPDLSLIALDKNKIIGQILLSKISIVSGKNSTGSLALAPVSVLSAYQNKGVGRQLIQKALETAKNLNFESVIVLGHSDYYPKFGFKKASNWNIEAPFDVPKDTLMAMELKEHALDNVSGVIHYPNAFFES
ncbi:N-acetyltransferase [Staphylococcus epidermidis]|uniref:GNAT family N-acetyltransferase n=1 Tax=Staphylococcus epidermidis TaxID=1282 RepID=UPI001888E6C4|nr:N-acetyltransferase [Staphylococcus epidermidis]MBF2188965.1 N-acetyltransferase [Staphylococcus epidermidis]MBM6369352.1 N-acetyltransferase [Staphylococcus epidermidis]MCG2107833.1 N-acetyltransferase [Staphylococcus epidermidis]